MLVEWEPDELVLYLSRLRILGLFYHLLISAGVFVQPLISRMSEIERCHELFVGVLAKELRGVCADLGTVGICPVLLKGPSFWEWLYPKPQMRQVSDIDLLIARTDQVLPACAILEDRGFVSKSVNNEHRLGRDEEYEMNPYMRKVRCQVDAKLKRSLIWLQSQGMGLAEGFEDSSADLRIKVEVHKALFMRRGGEPLQTTHQGVYETAKFDNCNRLSVAANLPYLSAKYSFDKVFHTPKRAKLFGDFVRVLQIADDRTIETSVELAEKWGCVHHYVNMLRRSIDLVPELKINGVERCDSRELECLVGEVITIQ